MRLALSFLTVLPVRSGPVDHGTARRAMLLAPLVGALLGLLAGLVALAGTLAGTSAVLAAALAVATLALLTRALHLDGLVDTADGLGSARPPDEALAVMKRSDIGPFGVVTVVLVLLVDVAAVASVWDSRGAAYGAAALVVAAAAGRVPVTVACRRGVPAARHGGLGALVAQSVHPGAAAGTAATVALAAAALIGLVSAQVTGAVAGGAAVAVAIASCLVIERRCLARLGGVTGDVLGALVECGQAAALVTLAVA